VKSNALALICVGSVSALGTNPLWAGLKGWGQVLLVFTEIPPLTFPFTMT